MSRPIVLLGVLWMLAPALAGCDSGSFMPPPPPGLNSPAFGPAESAAKVVELVLTTEETSDRRLWAQVVRMDASLARASFRVSTLAPKDPPERQAELIRNAVARGATVLIVEPARVPQVAEALEQVRARGTPVVLLDRSIAPPSAGKPFPVVLPAPFTASARELVEAAVADAKAAKLPADGSAIILVPKTPEAHTHDIRTAFEEALKGAGVSPVETVEFDGTGEGANTTVTARLKADPKITLVLAASGDAIAGAVGAREKAKDQHPVVVAGYGELALGGNEVMYESTAAVADSNVTKAAREALQVALKLADGQSVPDRTEIPLTVRRFSSKVPQPVPMPSTRVPEEPPSK